MDDVVRSIMQRKNGQGDFYCFFIGREEMATIEGVISRECLVLMGNAVMEDGKVSLWTIGNQGFGKETSTIRFSPLQVFAVMYNPILDGDVDKYLMKLEKEHKRNERKRYCYWKANPQIFIDAKMLPSANGLARIMHPIYYEATEDDPLLHYMTCFREGMMRKAGWVFSDKVTHPSSIREGLMERLKEEGSEETEGAGPQKRVIRLQDYRNRGER